MRSSSFLVPCLLPLVLGAVPVPDQAALRDVGALSPAPEIALVPARVLRWGGGTFVQVEQRAAGLPVWGGRLVAAYDGQGALRAVHGNLVRSLPFVLAPALPAEGAMARAQGLVADELGDGALWRPRTTLGLLARTGRADLAWGVDVSTSDPPGAWRVFVDALDGRVLDVRQTSWTASANVYPTNPAASDLVEVVLPIDGDELSNGYAWVNSCTDFDDQYWTCNATEVQATPDQGGNFYFEPDAVADEDPFAEVQMFWHLDRVARYFDEEFGFQVDFGLGQHAVQGIVNFDLANAFFGDADGDGIPEVAFGEGYGIDFAYDADVVYHEFGHAVFGQVVETAGGRWDEYGRVTAPAGLNEGTADLFSLVLTGDPHLGEYAGGGLLSDGAIRDLEADRHCPTDIYGESHMDGEIWGAFGWNVIDDPLLGAEVAAHLVFGALHEWPEDVSWEIAGHSLLGSAAALLDEGFISQEQHDAITGHVAAAGLDDCGRVIRLDEGQEPTQMISGRVRNDGTVRVSPLPNQFSLDAPAGTVALRFYVEELEADEGLGWTVFVRRGEHVVHEVTEDEESHWSLAVATEFDFSADGSGDGLAVELTADTDPPLVTGETWYFAITSRMEEGAEGRASGEITLRGEADIVPVEDEPAGDDEGVACDDCGSRVAGGRSGGWPMVGLVLAALALPRRRRAARQEETPAHRRCGW